MLKVCYLELSYNQANFIFPDIGKNEALSLIKYKSWAFSSWKNKEMIDYLEYYEHEETGDTVLRTKHGIGFVPIFVKHLRTLGFTIFETNGRPYNIFANCKRTQYPLVKIQLRPYQFDCVNKWMRDGLGIIKSPTGSGKTLMASYIISKMNFKTLILVHTIDLTEQWEQSLCKTFGKSFAVSIGQFGAGKDIKNALMNKVVIGTYQSALKEQNINKLKSAGFGLLVSDECLPKDSIVETNYGNISVERLKNKYSDMRIRCFDLVKQKIQLTDFNVFATKIKNVYTITLEDGTQINSSLDHKFLTKTDNGLEYKELIYCNNMICPIDTSIMPFETWKNKFNNDFTVIDIDKIESRSTEQCYNIAVENENHNYLLNGIVSKNCHHVAAETFKKVHNNMLVPLKLGLSATPKRLDGKEGEIYALVDNIKASVAIRELINSGYIVEPKFYNIYWQNREIVNKINNSNTKGLARARLLKQESAFCNQKYYMVLNLLRQFAQKDETFLLFADYVDSASVIQEIIERYITVQYPNFVVFNITQDYKSEERYAVFKELGNRISGLVFAKLGSEGIDIPTVDNIVIMSPSKSPTTFSQRVGRGLRPAKGKKYCKIYQFILESTTEEKWSEYSFDEYRNEKFIPKKTKMAVT